MRGHANIKTVKGGFKPEKLEKKKFELGVISNPFAVDDYESSSEGEVPIESIVSVQEQETLRSQI